MRATQMNVALTKCVHFNLCYLYEKASSRERQTGEGIKIYIFSLKKKKRHSEGWELHELAERETHESWLEAPAVESIVSAVWAGAKTLADAKQAQHQEESLEPQHTGQ